MEKPTESELTYLERLEQKRKIPKEYFLYGWTKKEIFKKKLLEAIKKVSDSNGKDYRINEKKNKEE